MDKKIYICSLVSLLISICLGLLLRLQIAGFISQIELLDIRRVHTHMGFYLFLFPVIWVTFKSTSWSPKSKILRLYFLVGAMALVSFLFFGYSTLSKILSGIILLFWLFYALVNLKRGPAVSGWLHPFCGIILATCSAGLIIFFGVQGETLLANKAVHVFITCLVWGVFVPFCLEKRNYPQLNILVWVLCIILTCIYIMDVNFSSKTFLGPIGLAICLMVVIRKKLKINNSRLDLYWFISAMSLLLFGLGVIKNQHYTAIGGLHFIILGPILQSIFKFKRFKNLWVYDTSLVVMVLAISAPGVIPEHYKIMQVAASGASILLVLWLMISLTSLIKSSIKGHPQEDE